MYTMTQVCRELNIIYQTLKYYCNEGLVPGVNIIAMKDWCQVSKEIVTIARFSMKKM